MAQALASEPFWYRSMVRKERSNCAQQCRSFGATGHGYCLEHHSPYTPAGLLRWWFLKSFALSCQKTVARSQDDRSSGFRLHLASHAARLLTSGGWNTPATNAKRRSKKEYRFALTAAL